MAWVKVDDAFPDHPKAMDLSLAAHGLWLVGLCYANRVMTDGAVPRALLRRTGDPAATDAAAELVAAGLWVETATGWAIHEYTEYQRSRAQIEGALALKAEAGRRGGKQKASNAEANAKQAAGKPVAPRKQPSSKNLADGYQKRIEEKRTEEKRTEDAAGAGADAPPRSEPYAMFVALCEETGADEAAASRSFKAQQLGIAKNLAADGFAESDIRECVRYLKSQGWRTGIIDLKTVSAEIGRWSLAGRPAAEPTPIRPGIATGKTRDQESRDALETFLAIANGAPL